MTPFYRAGVGVIIFTGDMIALFERTIQPGTFQTVQGGIEDGENPVQAAVRELKEEVGLSGVIPHKMPLVTVYSFPEGFLQKSRFPGCLGQVHQWFLVMCPGTYRDTQFTLNEEFKSVQYFNPASQEVYKVLPDFKKEVLRSAIWEAMLLKERLDYAKA